MPQHFLLSAKARTLSVLKVMQMTDAEAFTVFKEMRWGAGEESGGGKTMRIKTVEEPDNWSAWLKDVFSQVF